MDASISEHVDGEGDALSIHGIKLRLEPDDEAGTRYWTAHNDTWAKIGPNFKLSTSLVCPSSS